MRMKRILPLAAIFICWAATAMGSEFPPYGNTHPVAPFFAGFSQEQPEKTVEIFPNPVYEGRITIKSEESFRSVQVMNITGELVVNREYPLGTQTEVIELENLEKGIYLVRIGFEGKVTHTEKIMVK